jgi:hypothetical protein
MSELAIKIDYAPEEFCDATMGFWGGHFRKRVEYGVDTVTRDTSNLSQTSFPRGRVRPINRTFTKVSPLPSATDEQRLREYLRNLTTQEIGLSDQHAREVRRFWEFLNFVMDDLMLPIALPGGELGFSFVWNSKEVNITIEIGQDGTFDWFFRDKLSDEILGTENEHLPCLPPELCRKLYLHCRAL